MEQRNHVISIPKVNGYESSKNAIKPTAESDETITNNGFFRTLSYWRCEMQCGLMARSLMSG